MAQSDASHARTPAYVVGKDGLSRWPEPCAAAWVGMLHAHRRLTRQLEADLEARHGLSLSSLELLGRLAASPRRRRRLSDLAQEAGLSLSRVSRIVDTLEARGMVVRRRCTADARAIDAQLTPEGLRATCAAQATHFEGVQRRFFDQLAPEEIELLSSVFSRIAPGDACGSAGSCRRPGGLSALSGYRPGTPHPQPGGPMERPEHNPGEPEFGEHADEAPHNPGEPEFGEEPGPDEEQADTDGDQPA